MRNERGRSMLETLSVLAIIGILSVAALFGFSYVMNKNRANRAIQDASLIYGSVESTETEYPNWTEYSIAAESGFVFKVIRATGHGKLITYVQAIEVPEKICEHMLKMKGGKVVYYDVYENGEMALVQKASCAEFNNIGIAFDGSKGGVKPKDYGCQEDEYWNGSSCATCPAGAVCDGANANCGEGKYVDNDGNCASCPDGLTSCNGTNANCGEGKYIDRNGNCADCPGSNLVCDGKKFSCHEGYVFNGNIEELYGCCREQSEYWDGETCEFCPTGMTCNGTSADCPSGYLLAKVYQNNAYCCEIGREYWNERKFNCSSCIAHGVCDGKNITGCAEGYTLHKEGQNVGCCGNTSQYWTGVCQFCPNGATCDGTNANCGVGYYLNKIGACKPCPTGAICDGVNVNGCAANYISHGNVPNLYCCNSANEYWNGSFCSFCPSYATCNETGIETCGEGKYLLEEGGCYICPSGAVCNGTGVNCGGNGFLYYDHETNSCKTCPNGATCDGTKADCGSGKYLNNAGVCKNCPNGGTCDGKNVRCNEGSFLFEKNGADKYCCTSNQYWNDNGCAACPSGATCEAGKITNCGEGKYKNGTNCANCPDNARCDGFTIVDCGEGRYVSGNKCNACPNNNTTCEGDNCPSGYILHTNYSGISYCCSNTKEYWNGNKCVSCPNGMTCNGSEGNCGGDYTSHMTSTGNLACCKSNQYWISNTCRNCPNNATCDGTGASCKAGYVSHTYAPNTNSASNALYVNCCHGTNQYWNGSSCVNCPEGATCDGTRVTATSCNSNQYWNGSSCANCPSGATCDGTNVPKCGAGKYWSSDQQCRSCEDLYRRGAYNDAECLSCGTREIGEDGYCDWSCPLGWFRNANGNCTRCFNANAKETSKEECDKCDYPGSQHVRTYNNGSCEY
ncbi:MAG: type II secretion system protein [Alphaproteobacteria bacterium]|nr:type II secretion system protein [Alphaproteobacteria bacterium]